MAAGGVRHRGGGGRPPAAGLITQPFALRRKGQGVAKQSDRAPLLSAVPAAAGPDPAARPLQGVCGRRVDSRTQSRAAWGPGGRRRALSGEKGEPAASLSVGGAGAGRGGANAEGSLLVTMRVAAALPSAAPDTLARPSAFPLTSAFSSASCVTHTQSPNLEIWLFCKCIQEHETARRELYHFANFMKIPYHVANSGYVARPCGS